MPPSSSNAAQPQDLLETTAAQQGVSSPIWNLQGSVCGKHPPPPSPRVWSNDTQPIQDLVPEPVSADTVKALLELPVDTPCIQYTVSAIPWAEVQGLAKGLHDQSQAQSTSTCGVMCAHVGGILVSAASAHAYANRHYG
jgi:hypothetical protein